MELLQAIVGWAIIIGIVYGIWWLSEIPNRNQWGKTIAWAKERGYIIPPDLPSFGGLQSLWRSAYSCYPVFSHYMPARDQARGTPLR